MDTLCTTAFAQWMKDCRLSDAQAASALGLSKIMIRYLREGVKPNGDPCKPQTDTRMLMTAIAEGWHPKPWPM